jgi:two-component system NtrC family sensor kinase
MILPVVESALPRVLVIDDEPASARALARCFARRAEVTLSGGADDALVRIRAGERFDLILCDVMMRPKTGPDFVELAVAVAPELADRIVLVTGGVAPDQAQKIAALGVRCLAKPVSVSTLVALLDAARAMKVEP